MAEVAVTIRGVLYDLLNRTTQQVLLQGQASLTGLTVGGGPIYPEVPGEVPPGGDAHPEHPIFYPPHPEHPIYYPPGTQPPPGGGGAPGYPAFPIYGPGPYPPKPGYPPHPAHPIVNPPDKPPVDPPTEPPTDPPNSNWEWVWNAADGWHPAYVPGDKPRPLP